MLTAKAISKTYPNQQTPAVAALDLTVRKGEIVVIVGESGSGKTTLLKLLAGLEDTDEGEIRLNGRLVLGSAYNLIAGHKEIKLLQQDFNLLPRHKIAENIAYYLRWHSPDDQKRRVEELLAWCKLTEVAQKYPAELSGGQQQRAALAVALADEPTLLLLDEPFSQLDTQIKRQLRKDTQQILKQAGIGAVVVTHDIEDAFFLADRIGVMQAGKLLQIASPKEIYHAPLTPYVALLFKNANILEYKHLKPILQTYQKENAAKQVCLRYENIVLATTKNVAIFEAEAKVKSCLFLGSFYEVEVLLKNGTKLCLQTNLEVVNNQTVYVRLKTDKEAENLIWF